MNKQEQENFVKELMNNISEEIIERIEKDRIPDNWDGIELRWYIAEMANKSAIIGSKNLSRKRSYNNTVIVNNL